MGVAFLGKINFLKVKMKTKKTRKRLLVLSVLFMQRKYTYQASIGGIFNRLIEKLAIGIGLLFVWLMVSGLAYSIAEGKGSLIVPLIWGVFSILPFIFGLVTQFPDLAVSDEGIYAKLFWRWWLLPWSSIKVKSMTQYFLVVSSPNLPWIYLYIGSRAWAGKRCVFVNQGISGHDELIATIQQKLYLYSGIS